MKNLRIIAVGLVAAALSVSVVSGAQAYPPGANPGIVVLGGIPVNGKAPTASITTNKGANLTVRVNGVIVAQGVASGNTFPIATTFTKPGEYTVYVTDQDGSATSSIFVPGLKVPAKAKLAKPGTIELSTIAPDTRVSIKVNGKVVKSDKVGASASYKLKLVKKYFKKGRNKVIVTIGTKAFTKTVKIS
jgi:hypothetical protein